MGKAGAGLSAVGIDGIELGRHRADIDDLLARPSGLRSGRLPIGDAPRFHAGLGQRLARFARIENPLHLSAVRLEREDAVEGRTDINRVVNEDRSGFGIGFCRDAELFV